MAESVTYNELIKMLGDNYRKVESSIVNQILLNVDNHYPTVGSYRESVWKSLFEMIVPKKYCIEQGVFIIDSYGNKSREVDLVIFDELYTPYIFNYGEIKFIPIEAVAAVVQCKSHKVTYNNVSEWRESITKLFTSLDSVARMATYIADNEGSRVGGATQTATRPIMILCAIEPIKTISKLEKDFDIILSVDEMNKKLCKFVRDEDNSMDEWNNSLNHALKFTESEKKKFNQEVLEQIEKRDKIEKFNSKNQRNCFLKELKVMHTNDQGIEEENVLLSLIFQLNQLLMVLNNPMLFPHHAYAERFTTILKGTKEGEKDGQQEKSYILAKYDISGIQRYIFATNRLKENVGASCQVTKILEEYLPDAIREASAPQDTYVISWEKQDKLSLPHDKTINTEIIYIGGGNAMVLFRDKEVFQMVSRNLARKVAQSCQGIYLAAAYTDTPLVNFAEDVKKLNKNMADKKAGMIRQPIYSPFPAVEQDNSNHQPITRCYRHRDEANSYEKKGDKEKHQIENMTEMQYQKWIAYGEARRKRTGKLYPNIEEKVIYDYPVEMDALCREPGGNSYTAVVHIDGNGMGAQIQKVLREHAEYETAILGLRKKSKEISAVFENTYKEMLKVVYSYSKHPCSGDEDRIILPLRPIVLDGDDFTFLCTADLAIPLAVGFMKKLIKGQEGKPEKISACAGIAFVHSHFPFYEAYCIAEESCSDAKKKWYEESRENGSCESCFLDFRILKGSEVGGTVRHRELQMRPYNVDEKESRQDSLTALCETVKRMKEWPSNRLHRISRAMLEGDNQMKSLEREFISRDYHIEDLVQTDDWKNSPLYDALEIRGLCEMELLEDFLDMQENKGDGKMDSEDKVNK